MTVASPPQIAKPRRSHRRASSLRVDQRRLADLLPAQGEWTADDYLWLTRGTNHLVELADGWIEVLPMPTEDHQRVALNLVTRLHAWLEPQGGVVYFAPLRLRVAERRFREPDLLALVDAADARRGNDYWQGADLVVEIISPSNADHDRVTKRAEYAEARIPEYWIVDLDASCITVLSLEGGVYRDAGVFARGTVVASTLMPGLALKVDDVLDPR